MHTSIALVSPSAKPGANGSVQTSGILIPEALPSSANVLPELLIAPEMLSAFDITPYCVPVAIPVIFKRPRLLLVR